MSTSGQSPVSVVNGVRFRLTLRLLFTLSRFQDEYFLTFMLTWLDLSLNLVVSHTFSQSLIVLQDGLKSTTAEYCARVLLCSWIPFFGVPSEITSYRGAEFTGSIWSSLCKFLEIIYSPTTSFHLQSNGIVERFHAQTAQGFPPSSTCRI